MNPQTYPVRHYPYGMGNPYVKLSDYDALLQSFNAERLRAEKLTAQNASWKLLVEQNQQIATDAMARAEAMAKDAGRYRWLRENRDSKEVSVVFKIGDDKFDYAIAKHDHTFDQFIDTAIEQGAQHG